MAEAPESVERSFQELLRLGPNSPLLVDSSAGPPLGAPPPVPSHRSQPPVDGGVLRVLLATMERIEGKLDLHIKTYGSDINNMFKYIKKVKEVAASAAETRGEVLAVPAMLKTLASDLTGLRGSMVELIAKYDQLVLVSGNFTAGADSIQRLLEERQRLPHTPVLATSEALNQAASAGLLAGEPSVVKGLATREKTQTATAAEFAKPKPARDDLIALHHASLAGKDTKHHALVTSMFMVAANSKERGLISAMIRLMMERGTTAEGAVSATAKNSPCLSGKRVPVLEIASIAFVPSAQANNLRLVQGAPLFAQRCVAVYRDLSDEQVWGVFL